MPVVHGSSRPKITGSVVLIVEGKDEEFFFNALLRHLGISGTEIFDVGGKTQFKNKLPGVLLHPGFREHVKSYAIIRDAEQNAVQTFESVQNILQNNRQPCPPVHNTFATGPPKVGVFIVPGNAEKGMLEDLCIRTIQSHPIMPCVDSFMDCIDGKVVWPVPTAPDAPIIENYRMPNNPTKARAKAFLAGNQTDLPSVGVAAQAGVWNFDHESLQDLRNFLLQLRLT
jgi:hypothetical protein